MGGNLCRNVNDTRLHVAAITAGASPSLMTTWFSRTERLFKQLNSQPEVDEEEPDIKFIFCHFQGFSYKRNRRGGIDSKIQVMQQNLSWKQNKRKANFRRSALPSRSGKCIQDIQQKALNPHRSLHFPPLLRNYSRAVLFMLFDRSLEGIVT